MSDIHTNRPGFLDESTFLVRITQHDGRAVEDALGGATLFDCGVRLRGGIVEATYAADEPPVLKRLREDGVPYIVEPQTVRFTSERFLEVGRFDRLPYAPKAPVAANALPPSASAELACGVMRFQRPLAPRAI